MSNKLKEEIEKIQKSAANEIVLSWYLARLASTISIACYAMDKDNIAEAKEWLFNANGMWSDVDIFEDLKDSNGSAEDLQAWFDKGMEGEKDHRQAMTIIHDLFPEIEKLRNSTRIHQHLIKPVNDDI